jgi:hypothetical protein
MHSTIEEWRFQCGLRRGVILKTIKLLSVESQPVKRILGILCEMAAGL